MPKQKIFFSYSRADGAAFALRLAVDLKAKGFDVWIDQQDIRAGLEWDTEIEKALESCDCVLFLETEKSVVSHNVLDEVYYALEKNKKVIPLIYVDSKTPFRLNRLQHIDFTGNYDTGFALLVNELEGNASAGINNLKETTPLSVGKTFYSRNYRTLLVLAGLVLLTAVLIIFNGRNKSDISSETEGAIVLNDTTAAEKTNVLPDTAGSNVKPEAQITQEEIVSKNDNKRTDARNKATYTNVQPKTAAVKTIPSAGNLNEMVAGNWQLTGVNPKASSQNGYLKIEALTENKATIKTYMQFYYPDSKATSYLTVFNAFAGCASCVVNKEMKLTVEDIAVGSHVIKKLQEDQADGRKAGDVTLDAHSNKSVRGTVTLQFADNQNAVIIVKQPATVALANELMLEPFVYTFRFKKSE